MSFVEAFALSTTSISPPPIFTIAGSAITSKKTRTGDNMSNEPPADNPFSAASLGDLIAASLPTTSQPQLATPFDAIAIAAHACFLAVDFRLVGLGEDHRLDTPSTLQNPQPLPESWKANSGHYSFRYKHNQSSMEYLLQISKMGSKAVVLGMALGADKSTTVDVSVSEFVSDGNLPASPTRDHSDKTAIRKALGDVFITVGRLSDFGSLIRVKVMQKLIPGLSKVGIGASNAAEEEEATAERRRNEQAGQDPSRSDRYRPRQPYPVHDPLARPRPPLPEDIPGFEDEHQILRPQRGGVGDGFGPRFGDRDLYPTGLGPRDPLYGGVGPGLDPRGGRGGMHPTFDDPLFTGQGGPGRGDEGGFDIRNPPGSRYDQVGPGNLHPRGAGMGGRPPNPFGGFGQGDFI